MVGMNKNQLAVIGLSNELPREGRSLCIPYDSYEHRAAKIDQILNKAAAQLIVMHFVNQSKLPNFRGLPVYIGHPDVKAFYDKYRDHRSYGWITEIIAHDDYLEMQVDWTTPGEEMIANEQFVYFSPYWMTKRANGAAHPFAIRSVGLTHEPMIQYLACEDETQMEEDTMTLLERIKALLPQAAAENIANEDDAVSVIQKLIEGIKALREAEKARWAAQDAAYMALENEDLVLGLTAYCEELHTQLAALANEVPESVTATMTQLQDELGLANESVTSIQGKYKGLLLDNALTDGRITPATRVKWEEKFNADGADFAALANELGAIDPTMKTRRRTEDGKPEDGTELTHSDLNAEAMALANENPAMGYAKAYQTVSKREKFAHLLPE